MNAKRAARRRTGPAETPAPPTEAAAEPERTFEESLAELETLVRELETGQLDLSTALDRYEKGVTCLRHCYHLLESAERRIELLVGLDSDGEGRTREWKESDRTSQETPSAGIDPLAGSESEATDVSGEGVPGAGGGGRSDEPWEAEPYADDGEEDEPLPPDGGGRLFS